MQDMKSAVISQLCRHVSLSKLLALSACGLSFPVCQVESKRNKGADVDNTAHPESLDVRGRHLGPRATTECSAESSGCRVQPLAYNRGL